MKKVLFATTALVASAGFAAADVTLSGSAEMGVYGGSAINAARTGTNDIETQFWNDIDVTFTLSGETDNGLTFGATIDLDEVGDDCNLATQTLTDSGGDTVSVTACTGGDPISATGAGEEHSVFISGNFGTLTMGDTDGAFDWAMQEVGIGSAIADDHTTHIRFSGNGGLDGTWDGQVARYDYSFGDFSFAVSAELDDTGVGSPVFGIGGGYSAELGGATVGVGLGYQTRDDTARWDTIMGVSANVAFDNGFAIAANYSSASAGTGFTTDSSHWGVGVSYTADALTVSANYGVRDNWFDAGFGQYYDGKGYGLAVNYDLGGGAVVQFGYGSSEYTGALTTTKVSTDTFSFGLAMSF